MQGYLKKAIVTLLLILTLVCTTQAYIITIDAPNSVFVGSPLIVTGTTSFPEDTTFDLVLYYSKYTAEQITRHGVIVDKSQQFRVNFETRDLTKGQYKVEVHNIISDNELFVESQLGSASVIRRIIQFIDRSDEIVITSPAAQALAQALTVSGRVKGLGQGVLTMRVFGPENYTYGPEQIITSSGYADNDGYFSTTVAVPGGGDYTVSFSDKDGFIGEYLFTVAAPEVEEELIIEEIPIPTVQTEEPTPLPTVPEPTPTKSPLNLLILPAALIGAGYLLQKKE